MAFYYNSAPFIDKGKGGQPGAWAWAGLLPGSSVVGTVAGGIGRVVRDMLRRVVGGWLLVVQQQQQQEGGGSR